MASADHWNDVSPDASGRFFAGARALSLNFVLSRLARSAAAIWGVVTLIFFMILATGSPITLLAGPLASREEIAQLNAIYGFDRPLHEQYLRFVWNLLHGRFPDSLRFNSSPFDLLAPALPLTLQLGAAALALGAVMGLLAGYVSALSRSRIFRDIPLLVLSLFQSTPVFVTGLLLVLLFSLTFRLLPTSGHGELKHLVLPAVTLSLLVAPPIARLFRASILQQLGADHVRTALSKDITLRQVRLRHVAANALTPVVILIGLQAGSVLGGAVLTETVFNWPGVGTVMVNAVAARDYPVVLAAAILVAVAVCLSNFIADILAATIDPRAAAAR